jgi:hypothetical protein
LRDAVRAFPLKRVAAARAKATGDHEQTLLLLQMGGTLHTIAGSQPAPLADVLVMSTPGEIAQELTQEQRQEVVYESLKRMESSGVAEVINQALQLHPATSIKPPLGLSPPAKFGFTLEMGGPGARLRSAIDDYVSAWNEHIATARDEEVEVERNMLAPKLLLLRMTVEEVEVP